MLPLLVLMLAPYLVKRSLGVTQPGVMLGFLPPGLAAKAAGMAKSQAGGPAAQPAKPAGQAAPASGMPSPVMMATLGPAAMLTTPQGKAGVARGITMLKKARNGDKKSKKRIAKTKRAAANGDPKAKRDLAALQAAEMVQEEVDENDGADSDDEMSGDDFEDMMGWDY